MSALSTSDPPPRTNSPQPYPVKRFRSRSRPRRPPSRTQSPLDLSTITSSPIPQTSLYTYPSHSSLASLYSAHGRTSPAKQSTDTSRCSTPLSLDENTRFVAVIAPVSIVAPSGPLPATPPPGEFGLSDEDEDSGMESGDVEEMSHTKQVDSPRKSLRRARARISGPTEPVILTTEDIVMADVLPTSTRRGSAQLHHPKPLRSSPKSAYFEEEYGLEGKSESKRVALEDSGVPRPDSPLEGKSTTAATSNLDGPAKPAPIENLSRKLEAAFTNAHPDGIASGAKERITNAGGRKVTPWPTPHTASFETRKGEMEDDNDESAIEDDSVVDMVDDLRNDRSPSSPSIPPRRSSLPSSMVSQEASTQPTRSFSESRRKSPFSPMASDARPPDRSSFDAKRKSDVVVVQEAPQVVQPTIVEPPADTNAPSTPQKPIAPVLNIIPPTPLVEVEKQLGGPPEPMPSLLSRKATGLLGSSANHGSLESIGETQPLDTPDTPIAPTEAPKPKRPSIVALPSKVRDSKLHPWWRPRRFAPDDEFFDGPPYLDGTPEHPSKFTENTASETSSKAKLGKKGRVSKRIKGTNLVVEFIGWRGLGDAVMRKRKSKNKQRKLNRKASGNTCTS